MSVKTLLFSAQEQLEVNIPLVSWWINLIAADQKPKDFLVKWPSLLSHWYLLSCVIQTLTMISKKVVVSLLLVYVVSMLAEQTKGFMPFFTKSDFQKMQVTPKTGAGALNKPGKVFLPPSSPKLCQCTLCHCHSHHLRLLFK